MMPSVKNHHSVCRYANVIIARIDAHICSNNKHTIYFIIHKYFVYTNINIQHVVLV